MKLENRDIQVTGGFARLFSQGLLSIAVAERGPAPAWTQWDKTHRYFEIYFRRDVMDEWTDDQLRFLIHHEIAHVIMGHFNWDECRGQDALVAADINVNYYLRDYDDMIRDFGGVVAKDWLEELELEYQAYPFPVLHDLLHKKIEDMGGFENGMCGGIEGADEDAVASAIAIAARGTLSEDEREEVGAGIGSKSAGLNIKSLSPPRPEWANKVSEFAQNAVNLVLGSRRTHKKPSWSHKAVGLYVPTVQPTWVYEPDTVIILLDTSGSMYELIHQIGPTVEYLNRHNIKVRLIAGDTQVLMDEEITAPPDSYPGGGGTDIVPLFERAEDYHPRALICFSDGYVMRWPKAPDYPVLWIMDNAVKAPFGEQVEAK